MSTVKLDDRIPVINHIFSKIGEKSINYRKTFSLIKEASFVFKSRKRNHFKSNVPLQRAK